MSSIKKQKQKITTKRKVIDNTSDSNAKEQKIEINSTNFIIYYDTNKELKLDTSILCLKSAYFKILIEDSKGTELHLEGVNEHYGVLEMAMQIVYEPDRCFEICPLFTINDQDLNFTTIQKWKSIFYWFNYFICHEASRVISKLLYSFCFELQLIVSAQWNQWNDGQEKYGNSIRQTVAPLCQGALLKITLNRQDSRYQLDTTSSRILNRINTIARYIHYLLNGKVISMHKMLPYGERLCDIDFDTFSSKTETQIDNLIQIYLIPILSEQVERLVQLNNSDIGISTDRIIQELKDTYSELEIRRTIDFLNHEGHIYTTLDDQHFKPTFY